MGRVESRLTGKFRFIILKTSKLWRQPLIDRKPIDCSDVALKARRLLGSLPADSASRISDAARVYIRTNLRGKTGHSFTEISVRRRIFDVYQSN